MIKKYEFIHNGSIVGEDCYGHGRDDTQEGKYLDSMRYIASRYSNKTGNILEWGSGVSTLVLSELVSQNEKGFLLTIDNDKNYLTSVVDAIDNKKRVVALGIDLIGPRESQSDVCLNYSSYPLRFAEEFDVIYIDGRRRMECALTAAIISHEDTVVFIHDYRRARYQTAMALFDVIEDGPHFRVMKVNPEIRNNFLRERHKIDAAIFANGVPLLRSTSNCEWIVVVNEAQGFSI